MISISELTKNYGKLKVIDSLSLELNSGQLYCLLGKNGAGKTTFLKIILDILSFESGSVDIFGSPCNELNKKQKERIGAMIDGSFLLEELTGNQYLNFIGRIYNIEKQQLLHRIKDLTNFFFDDEAQMNKSISTYSTGMRKKIEFCAAVINKPEILILDEPFSGLDPIAADRLVSFLKSYATEQRLILLSSHDLSFVQKLATHIGVLEDSKLLFNSTLTDFTLNGETQIDSALLEILSTKSVSVHSFDWI